MAYDRYDTRNAPRGDRSRWRDDPNEGRGWNRDREFGRHDERGFFERAGDEIASWFGDDDAERRRERDRVRDERDYGSGRRSAWRSDRDLGSRFFGSSDDEDRGSFWRDRSWGRGDFDRGRSESSGWRSTDRDFDRGYRPMTGDYGRSEQFGRGDDDRSDFSRSQSPWGRDEYRRTSFIGTRARENSHDFDPHYRSWRERQMTELDRDYDDYRRENQSRFEHDFGSWRERRQQKRSLLGNIREHMEVVGNDDQHVGTVDRVVSDRIILAKSDPESGGAHHSLSCSDIDRVEGDRVILDCSADQAQQRWRDESRSRGLFEREDQGEMGPRVLDRSFEGTYRS